MSWYPSMPGIPMSLTITSGVAHLEQPQRLLGGTRGADPRTLILQYATHELARVGLVVDDEHFEASELRKNRRGSASVGCVGCTRAVSAAPSWTTRSGSFT